MQITITFLAFSLVFCQADAGNNNLFNENQILDQIFTECETPTLRIFQIRYYLESLKNFYASEPRKFLSQAEISKYLDLAESSERASCFNEDIYVNIELAIKSTKGRCNLGKFLAHYEQLYSDRCNRDVSNALLDSIAKVPRNIVADLNSLAKSVQSVSKWKLNRKRPFYPQEALIQGIYNYLVEISAGMKVSEKPDKCKIKIHKFSKLYKAKIVNLCEQTGHDFRGISKTLLDTVAVNTKTINSFDLVIRSWLLNANICLDILDKNKQIEIETYYLYKENKPESVLHYLCYFY